MGNQAFDFDFTGETPESLDFFRPIPGWYLATYRGYKTDEKEGFLTHDYRIDGPSMKGATLHDRLDNPRFCPQAEWLEMRQRKWKVYADRLIFQGKAPCGQKVMASFDYAIGKQFVINVKDGSYESKKTGAQVDSVKLDYAPYPLDHSGIPVPVRQYLGLDLLPGQVAPQEQLPKGATRKKAGAQPSGGAQPAQQSQPPTGEAVDQVLSGLGL